MGNGRDWISRNVSGVGLSAIKDMAMRAAKVPDVASLAWGLPNLLSGIDRKNGCSKALC